MAASKSGFMKDALILFAITLVSGLCLGVVYDVTKAPIEAATIAANNATYKQVLPEAESFDDVEGSTEKIAETADEIANLGLRRRCDRVRSRGKGRKRRSSRTCDQLPVQRLLRRSCQALHRL